VSTPALAAIAACLSDKAHEIAAAAAEDLVAQREFLVEQLAAIGWPAAGSPAAPFVLIHTDRPSLWQDLRTEGFAVRRGETFPGLGPDWIRVAVRDVATSARFVAALVRVLGKGSGRG
jgi:histidinol-phosphate/aromatic aminotransferase/cobyric acid decarboxylase-like protein